MIAFFSRRKGAEPSPPAMAEEAGGFIGEADDLLDAVAGQPGNTRAYNARVAHDEAFGAQRRTAISRAIRDGFAACDTRLVGALPGAHTTGRLAATRAAHKDARREVLRTAIALYGRDAVERVLSAEHRQDLFLDYGISYTER